MKVTCIVHNLSANPIVRAFPIIEALKHLNYEVEVVGFTIKSDSVYEPYKDKLSYKTIRIDKLNFQTLYKKTKELKKLVSGDIIYAFKPLLTTYLPALLISNFGRKKQLMLDIEDEELWYYGMGYGIRNLFKHPNDVLNPFYSRLLHPFTKLAQHKTVVSDYLQKRYGGIKIYHGPDEQKFDPALYKSSTERNNFKLPDSKYLALFAGSPQVYKGFNLLVDCLNNTELGNWVLVLAGNSDNNMFKEAKKILGDRCMLLGNVPNNKMPNLLAAIDCVPLLQLKNKATEAQIPAKIFEALAMNKAIISTQVSDIPNILQDQDKRGWLIEDINITNIVHAFKDIETSIINKDSIFKNGRKYFLQNCGIKTMKEKISPLIITK